jgi:hypothetical protein
MFSNQTLVRARKLHRGDTRLYVRAVNNILRFLLVTDGVIGWYSHDDVSMTEDGRYSLECARFYISEIPICYMEIPVGNGYCRHRLVQDAYYLLAVSPSLINSNASG